MAKRLLSPDEINQLVLLLKDVFTYISDLKKKNRFAADIQYPKLPPRLTESLAIHLLQGGLISELAGYNFRLAGKEADIVGLRGANKVRIEVKGTTKGFEYFGPKDIKANYLLWFDFEELLKNGGEKFVLYLLPHKPSRFSGPVKITISSLKKVAGADLREMTFSIGDLQSKIISPTLD